MSMKASYTVENVLHYSIPVSNHLLNKAIKRRCLQASSKVGNRPKTQNFETLSE